MPPNTREYQRAYMLEYQRRKDTITCPYCNKNVIKSRFAIHKKGKKHKRLVSREMDLLNLLTENEPKKTH